MGMGKALLLVRRPMVRVADAVRYDKDRRRHIRQFQRVTRVTLQEQ